MENEVKSVTLGKIIKVAFTNWKLFVPVALVTTISAAIGIHFGFNTIRGSYSSTFSYSSPDLVANQYADGSGFYYRNLISYSNLKAIKDSNPDYKSIDIDKILDNNGINITEDTDEKTYTVSISYRFLKDQNLAKNFIKDITESALKRDADIVNNGNYDNALKLFDTAGSFEDQLQYLNSEAQYLLSQYKVLIEGPTATTKTTSSSSSSSSSSNNNTTTQEERIKLPSAVIAQATANSQQISLLIPDSFVGNMKSIIKSKGLAMDYSTEATAKLEEKEAALAAEKSSNDNYLDELAATLNKIGENKAAYAAFSETFEKYIVRNAEIQNELDTITEQKKNEGKDPSEVDGHTDFVNDLADYRASLSSAVDSYKDVLRFAYINNAAVDYENSSIVSLKGTINIYINLVISVLLGVIVGGVVDLVVYRKKLYE